MSVASKEQAVVDAVPKKLYIGGEWRDGAAEGSIPVEDPSTEEVIAEIADADASDADAALASCVEHQAEWQHTPPRDRGEILRRAYELITERADELALLMTLEMGKSIAESKAEVKPEHSARCLLHPECFPPGSTPVSPTEGEPRRG